MTPAVHVASAAHTVHGAFPEVEKVLPATHATWHTEFFVLVHTDFTPWAHVLQLVHGVLPEAEKVLPATHGT